LHASELEAIQQPLVIVLEMRWDGCGYCQCRLLVLQ
jgi:hypothetical protein